MTPEERALLDEARRDPRRRLGPLVVLRELGRGGMGQVLLAWDERRGDLVAVKTLLEHVTGSARERLEREARLLAGLDDPGVARLHEAVLEGPGAPYLVMEFVRGRPLAALVDEDQPVEPRRAAALVAAVARAVAAAHARGIVHRDLKPHNVLVREDGRPAVLDFGLARREHNASVDLTRTGSVVGTPAYLAPEQIGGARRADARADVYALGGVLYALLTGHVPFEGPTALVLAQVRGVPPPPPSEHVPGIDPALEALVLACLAKRPEDRPQRALDVAERLEAWLADRSSARRASVRAAPRRRGVVAGLAAGAVALLVGLALALRSGPTPPVEAAPVAGAPAPATAPATPLAPAPPSAPTPPPTPPTRDEVEARVQALMAEVLRLVETDPAAAEALCAEALALAPDSSDAHAGRGYVAFRRGDKRAAAAAYARAVELEPGDAMLHANLAANLAGAGERAPALAAFTRALALQPDLPFALLERGVLLVDLERDAEGLADLEAGLRLDPQDRRGLDALARARDRLGEHVAAAEAHRRLAALEPASPAHRCNAAISLLRAERRDEALRAAEQGVALGPGLAAAWVTRALARAERGDLHGAAQDLAQALALDPASEHARETLATVNAALAAVPTPPPSPPDAAAREEARRLAAEAMRLRQDDAAAFALCERALALAPDVGEAWAARGYLHYSRGEHVDAVPDYAQAARLDPGRKVYRHNLGVNLAKAGDHAGALAAFDHALALAPDDKDVHVQRVLSLQALGRDEAAAAGLDELLRRWPTDVDAATTLGLLRFKRGEHAAAVEAYGLASRLRPDDAMHLVNRAVNLLELGRLEQALDDCERALALSPRLASAWRVRGEVRLRAGAVASAIADLERSWELRADPLTQRLLDEARARRGDR